MSTPPAVTTALKLHTAKEVSEMTGNAVSAYWLEKAARKEEIPARKVGRSWRWADEDVAELFATCLRVPRPRSRRR